MASKHKKNKRRKRLSSDLTFPYKFIVPLILICLLILLNYVLREQASNQERTEISIIYMITMTIAYLPLLNLKKVEYNSSSIFVSNFINEKNYRLKSIKKVNRSLIFFYKIQFTVDQKQATIKFMPRINFSNQFFGLFRSTQSITEFRKLVENNK